MLPSLIASLLCDCSAFLLVFLQCAFVIVGERRGKRVSGRIEENLRVFFLDQAESNTEATKEESGCDNLKSIW